MALSLSVLRRRQSGGQRPSFSVDFLSGTLDPAVTFTRASTATYFDSTGTLVSAATNTPRFDYNPTTLTVRGLLIEETRTNGIRNNTMQSASVGTPGGLPNYWATLFNTTTGITRSITGVGTDSGINYIDIRLSGTASGAGSVDILFDGSTGIPALTGQTWAASLYWKLQAGSTTGLSSPIVYLYEYTNTSGFITARAPISPTLPTSAELRTQRISGAATLAGGATTAYVRPLLKINIADSAVVDCTIRIGMPQLEQGAFTTSVIPTTTVALARSADIASVTGANFSRWYNAVAGTIYVEASTLPNVTAAVLTHAISDGTFNQSIYGNFTGGNLYIGANVLDGGVNQASNLGSFSIASSTNITKDALAYQANNFGESCNGAAPRSDTSGTVPTVNRLYIGSNWAGAGNYLNGHIRTLKYYPRRLSNAELQALTV